MSDLEPITRNEHFLSGTDLTPITREEHILAGEDLTPVTRHEWFLKKYRGGGSSVTVEALTVTENGTYSEEGKAYSPVTVNVDKGLEIVDLDKSDIVTFSDGLALPITSGKFYINAVQSGTGTPSPDNIRPITGFSSMDIAVCGKNLFDVNNVKNIAFASSVISENNSYRGYYINVKSGDVFTISRKTTSFPNRFRVAFTNEEPRQGVPFYYRGNQGSFIAADNLTSVTVTVENNMNYMVLYLSNENETITEEMQIQIEIGSTATTYEPYNGHTYSTTFSDTCYGGYYDSVNGKLVATYGYVDLGTLSWTWTNNNAWRVLDNAIKRYSGSDVPNLLCSEYKACSGADIYNGVVTEGVCLGNGYYTGDSGGIVVRDDVNLPSSANPNTVLNGVQLVYELATPIEIDISSICISTIEGTNNIYHNCNGETEVSVIKEA